jgi:hypothetical protein
MKKFIQKKRKNLGVIKHIKVKKAIPVTGLGRVGRTLNSNQCHHTKRRP